MTNPQDPVGATSPDASAPDDQQQLTDAGALENDGTAFDDMAEAAEEGDERLRAAEERLPLEQAEPYKESTGRS